MKLKVYLIVLLSLMITSSVLQSLYRTKTTQSIHELTKQVSELKREVSRDKRISFKRDSALIKLQKENIDLLRRLFNESARKNNRKSNNPVRLQPTRPEL